jgi:hypothetical protein
MLVTAGVGMNLKRLEQVEKVEDRRNTILYVLNHDIMYVALHT